MITLVCQLRVLSAGALAPSTPRMSSRGRSQGTRKSPWVALHRRPGRIRPAELLQRREEETLYKESSVGRTLRKHISQVLYFYKGGWNPEWLLMVTQTLNIKSGKCRLAAVRGVWRVTFQAPSSWVRIPLSSPLRPPRVPLGPLLPSFHHLLKCVTLSQLLKLPEPFSLSV